MNIVLEILEMAEIGIAIAVLFGILLHQYAVGLAYSDFQRGLGIIGNSK